MRNQITKIDPKKTVGYKHIAAIRMMFSGQEVYQLQNTLIAKKTAANNVILYTKEGVRYTKNSPEINLDLFASQ